MNGKLFLFLSIFSFSYASDSLLEFNQLRVLTGKSGTIVFYRCGQGEEGSVRLNQKVFPGDKKEDPFYSNVKDLIEQNYSDGKCIMLLQKYTEGKVTLSIVSNSSEAYDYEWNYIVTFKENK